jgi:nucleoside-diphosphate-sugar epimerase
MPRTWASIDCARAELGYDPRVELDPGLAEFVAWLRAEEPCASS